MSQHSAIGRGDYEIISCLCCLLYTSREHILGYLPQFEKPYWIGYCDVEDGCEFATAKELVEACVFNGKSLKERWDKVIIYSIEGIDLQDWLEVCEHCY